MTDQTAPRSRLLNACLRECREAKGWTLIQAAERLSEASGENVPHQRWSMWEHSDRVPSPKMAEALAGIFGTEPGYFSEPTE